MLGYFALITHEVRGKTEHSNHGREASLPVIVIIPEIGGLLQDDHG